MYLGVALNNFGDDALTSWADGNVDGVARVSSNDLGLLVNALGNAATPASAVAVPEAHGWLLMLLTCLAVPAIRRR